MSPGSAISALPRAPSPGWPMSLFAGTGFFTQSAVLFPTSIEKNKKTEACSRDPQASSLLHGKGRHRRPFFTGGRWGRQILGGGGGWEGGAAGLRIAKSLRSLHLPCKSTGNNRPDRGLVRKGDWARMPGQGGGADPKGTPNSRACPSLPAVLLAAACRGLPPAEHPSFTLWEGAVF